MVSVDGIDVDFDHVDHADGSGVDDDDDETSEEDNDEGLIDVMDGMDEAEREQVRTDMLPVKQMLSKV